MVIVIAPHTPETEGLFSAARLALLPDGALLVNVARGPLVDTDALVAETASGRLRAALDVTDPEPLPADHPLWRTPGVIIVPARRRRELGVLPPGRPLDRGPAAPIRHWSRTGEHHHMTPLEPPVDEVADPTCIFCKIIAGELPSRADLRR